MKLLKTRSRFIRVRPILIPALFVIIFDLIYVNQYMHKLYTLEEQTRSLKICGKVREKSLDENGDIQSVVVKDSICYVNNVSGACNVKIGDIVEISGNAKLIETAMNDGEFDKRRYYASKRIIYLLTPKEVRVVKKPSFYIRERFLQTKTKLTMSVLKFCPFEAGTINTLLFGDKSNLSKDREGLYKRAGVAHFLVISGLHISAVGNAIFYILKKCGLNRKISCVISALFLFLYGLLVGFSVSVTRAILMFGIKLLADIVKRVYDMLNAMAFAVIICILINPLKILDPAFVYSFSTVFAIAVFSTCYPKEIGEAGNWIVRIRDSIKLPLWLLIFLFPVYLRMSYSYSLASVAVNVCLIPLSAPILVLSFGAFLFSLFGCAPPAHFFDFIIAVILRYLDELCKLASKLRIFDFSGKPSLWKIIVYYVFLLIWIFYISTKKQLPKFLTPVFIAMALFFAGFNSYYRPSLSMLYVGQGECVVIRTQRTSAIVFDCGSSSKAGIAENVVVPWLKANGINTIEAIYMSHSDADHVNGMEYLIEKTDITGIDVKNLFIPGLKEAMKDETYRRIAGTAERNGLHVHEIYEGFSVSYRNVQIKVLSPDINTLSGDSNEDSVIIFANLSGLSILLTGDATKEAESRVADKGISADVLKVSHHGSDSASDEEFLCAIRPKLAIISAGINNRYKHPSDKVTGRLKKHNIPFLCTKECGQITIEKRNGKWHVNTYKKR